MRLPSPTSPTCGILRVLACNVVRGWNRTTGITRPTRPSIPPLLRGYLRLGAVVCGAPAIDIDFRTADFLVLSRHTKQIHAAEDYCRKAVCARLAALGIAVGAGVVFIGALASLPGYRRHRLGAATGFPLATSGVGSTPEHRRHSSIGTQPGGGNHVSWLDILVLSASAPMPMVAKSEVRSPAVAGDRERGVRAGTLFLRRERLRSLPESVAGIAAALRSGSRVQVSPRLRLAAAGRGLHSGEPLFQAAIDAGVVVSPVTIGYFDHRQQSSVLPAFVGGETLATSVRRVVGMSGLTARVSWLRPIPAIAGTGRDAVDRARVARLPENAVAVDLGIPVLEPLSGARPTPCRTEELISAR